MKQDKGLRLTDEDYDRLVKDYPLLDFSFEDDYREEAEILKQARIAKVKAHYEKNWMSPEECAECQVQWVSVLKEYKITVDSPTSLKASVDTLIREARKEGYKKGVFADKKFGEMDIQQAFKEGVDKTHEACDET